MSRVIDKLKLIDDLNVIGDSNLATLTVGSGTSSYLFPSEKGITDQVLSISTGDLEFITNPSVSSISVDTPIDYFSTLDEEIISSMSISPPSGSYTCDFNTDFEMEGTLITLAAKNDLQNIYDTLANSTFGGALTAPVSGTFTPGNYLYGAAAFGTSIILDADGDEDALFIFKFTGALTTAATSAISLIGLAQSSNVYFFTQIGAIALSSSNQLYGNFIGNEAVSMGASGKLDGRLTTLSGAIAINSSIISIPTGTTSISLGSIENFVLFTGAGQVGNTAQSTITGDIGTNTTPITGFVSPTVVNGDLYTSISMMGSFSIGIYVDGVLYPLSNKLTTSETNILNSIFSLHEIITIGSGKTIDVRIQITSGHIYFKERIFTMMRYGS